MDQWKIERDAFYGPLFRQYGLNHIIDAGFFFDDDSVDRNFDETLNTLCTPLSFLKKNQPNPCILLTTGSFCPIHYGHIQMMEAAKEAVEKRGFQVIGGYISPSHDKYVKAKTKHQWMPIHQRLALIKELVKKTSWLEIDPWEGVFNKVAINFTDVVVRLQKYVKHHTGVDVPVMYVCGGDNFRFSKTFANQGHCVVVTRPGYCGTESRNPRVILAEGFADISSTQIRNQTSSKSLEKKSLQLRVNDRDLNEVQILQKIASRFSQTTFHQLSDQLAVFSKLNKDRNIISIDTEIAGELTLGISRHYDLFGTTMIRYGSRPGLPAIEDQIKKIPAGRYILFDDDIHTGRTMRFAKQQLEFWGTKVSSITSLNISSPDVSEILDARDFLFGFSANGGLVIQLPNENLVRLPYIYPFVCPYLRASVLDPMQFSIDIWKSNADLHQQSKLTFGEVSYLKDFAEYVRLDPETTLAEWCHQQAESLESLK